MLRAVFAVLVLFVWFEDKEISQVLRLGEQRLVLLLFLCLLCELESVLQIETLPILMHLNFVLPPLLGLDLVWGQGPPLLIVSAG